MPPRPFVSPIPWQPLRQWLPASGTLLAALLLASAASRPAGPARQPPGALPESTLAHLSTQAAVPTARRTTDGASDQRAQVVATAAAPTEVFTPTTVRLLPSVAIHAARLGTPTTIEAPSSAGTPTTVDDATKTATSTMAVPSSTATATASVSTAATDPGTALAWVAAGWLVTLALLMAGAVTYLVCGLPRLAPRRAVAVTGTACGALALAGLALAVWADAGMAGALLSALLVALPALTLSSGHGGYVLGRAQRRSRPAAGAARRSAGPWTDAANAGQATAASPRPAASPADAAPDRALLGNFRIEGELGRGAMGVVYLGRHQRTGQRVALKTLALAAHRDGVDGAEAQRRFLREAALATRLRHPDIVAVVGSGEQQGLAYIALEFVDGHDLVRHTRADALLPWPVLVDAIARVAEALAYAHAQGVVHRDIKPANLMWNPVTRQVKVTDFGVARVVDGGRTATGVLMGTPTHLAPEQLAGRQVDGRTDLYALGVTLYQLITGQLPQRAESMVRLMFEIANVQAPDVRRLRPDTPPALAGIVARLLEKRPDDRYADGRSLAADLRGVLVTSGPAPAPTAVPAAADGIAPSSAAAAGHNSAF